MGMAIVDGGFDRPPELRKVRLFEEHKFARSNITRVLKRPSIIHCRTHSGIVPYGSHSMQRIRQMTTVMERKEWEDRPVRQSENELCFIMIDWMLVEDAVYSIFRKANIFSFHPKGEVRMVSLHGRKISDVHPLKEHPAAVWWVI